MTGVIGNLGGLGQPKFVQKSDGTYMQLEITADVVKKVIAERLPPQYQPYLNVIPAGDRFIVEVKLV